MRQRMADSAITSVLQSCPSPAVPVVSDNMASLVCTH
jgi:hypothetical protein